MGDIADMMLDGTLCQCCGVYIGSENGCPIFCEGCAKGNIEHTRNTAPTTKKVKCPECKKLVKKGQGLKDHSRVVHGEIIVETYKKGES